MNSTYRGTCDASAAITVAGTNCFVAASDEDYILRVYDRLEPGMPLAATDVTSFLTPQDVEKEPDIEGAAQLDDRVYWIGSHGRDKDGLEQESRQRLFATRILSASQTISIAPIGRPFRGLLKNLAESPALLPFGLAAAARLAPEAAGGLNIEGLAATLDGHLLFGFRNPIPQGKALVVRLHNPADLVDGRADSAVLTVGGLLDLGGRGIRAIEFISTARLYLLLAGAFDDTRDFRLFRWSGAMTDSPVPIETDALSDLNPEELIVATAPDGTLTVEVFSDDGDQIVGGKKCKKLAGANTALRTFRSVRFDVSVTA